MHIEKIVTESSCLWAPLEKYYERFCDKDLFCRWLGQLPPFATVGATVGKPMHAEDLPLCSYVT